MEKDFLKTIIEKTASRIERENESIFEKRFFNEEVLRLWKQYSSGDTGEDVFLKSLRLDNLDENVLSVQLYDVKLKCDGFEYIHKTKNDWIITLSHILDSYSENTEEYYKNFFGNMDLPPNRKLLCRAIMPIFRYIYARLQIAYPIDETVLRNVAFDSFEILEPICNDTFYVSAKRYYNTNDIDEYYYTESDYEKNEFIEWLYNGGIYEIASEYPMCFKLLVNSAELYIKNINELFKRINEDISDIQDGIFSGHKLQKITSIKPALSDPHNGGKMVCMITFDREHSMIYKPRSMDVDVAWNSFLNKLCSVSSVFSMVSLKIINKNEYGYVEYVKRTDTEQVDLYYKNAGVLLCLVSLFGGSDFHYENLIANGTTPVLIDLETIITPKPKRVFAEFEKGKDTINAANVGRTLLLPRWVGNSVNNAREIGGFSSLSDYGKNYHFNNGKKTSADQYISDFLNGYKQAYDYIVKNKEKVLAMISGCAFDKCKYRYVFRRTALYYNLYRHFLHAAFMKNALLYDAVLTRLGAGVLLTFADKTADGLWNMVTSEKNAIGNGDIPYFYCEGNSTSIIDASKLLIEDFFEISPIETVEKNMNAMSEEQLDCDIKFIRNSLILSSNQSQEQIGTELLSYQNIKRDRAEIDKTAILDEIDRIYEILKDYRIKELDFEYYAPVRDRKTTRYNLDILEDTYYSGTWGILLFYSAYARLKNDYELKNEILEKITELTEVYFKSDDQSIYLDLGIAQGVSGVLKCLMCIGEIFKNEELYAIAEKIALKVKPEFVSRCKETDFFGGLAGFVYSCSQLYFKTGNHALITIIREAAEELVKRATRYNNTLLWQTSMEYYPITGLAHGQSGYAVAMASAYKVLGEEKYIDLLKGVVEYEETAYDATQNNWLDYRKFNVARRQQQTGEQYNKRFMYGCCAGAPGIGMSRLILKNLLDNTDVFDIDIERAEKFCTEEEIVGNDSFCCGSMGWIDLLAELSVKNNNTSLLSEAKKIAAAVIPSNSGTDYVLSNLKGIYDIAFFKGMSGIGYQMIRLLDAEAVPSPIM